MTRRRSITFVLAALLLASTPAPATATNVVCTIDNGAVNGSDSLGGAYPGSDNPDGATGSYSVDNIWHDATEYEWCSPSHDWFKEKFVRWSTTAANKLHAEAATHTIQLEQNVFPADSYNYTGGHSSNLPYTGIYVADAAEQASQGFEEVSFIVSDPGRIVAGTNYFGYLQWEQEADGGFLDFSPLLNKVEVKIEYGNKLLIVQNWDMIGRWQKKIANNK